MLKAQDTYFASFKVDTTAEPPMSLEIVNGGVKTIVSAPMHGRDPLVYAQPNLGEPGMGQTVHGKDLDHAAELFAQALQEKGQKSYTLRPGEDTQVSRSPEGATIAEIPATAEVLLFIARAVNRVMKSA